MLMDKNMKVNKFVKKTLDFSKSIDINLVKKFIVFDEVSSTNIKAKELAQNDEEEGTIVIARIQKKGRGRFDRLWESPDGGLYLSIILRPNCSPDKATLLPLIASLVVCKTINSHYHLSAKIKWPNDVRVNGKKVAGILLESEVDGNQLHYVVLGIGVNLNIDVSLFPKELKNNATSILHELNATVDYHKFLEHLLCTLDNYYSMFLNGNFDTILREWRYYSDTLGRKVRIVTSSDELTGKVYDVDQSGFLIVITDSGEHKKITSGDCIYLDEL